jgi:hypothetical protein
MALDQIQYPSKHYQILSVLKKFFGWECSVIECFQKYKTKTLILQFVHLLPRPQARHIGHSSLPEVHLRRY